MDVGMLSIPADLEEIKTDRHDSDYQNSRQAWQVSGFENNETFESTSYCIWPRPNLGRFDTAEPARGSAMQTHCTLAVAPPVQAADAPRPNFP